MGQGGLYVTSLDRLPPLLIDLRSIIGIGPRGSISTLGKGHSAFSKGPSDLPATRMFDVLESFAKLEHAVIGGIRPKELPWRTGLTNTKTAG